MAMVTAVPTTRRFGRSGWMERCMKPKKRQCPTVAVSTPDSSLRSLSAICSGMGLIVYIRHLLCAGLQLLADAAMADHRDERTHTFDLGTFDARRHEADAIGGARHHMTPRIADERVTIGMTPFAVGNGAAGLAAGREIGLGFDG